jgi:S1-C subfamily serine protease
MWFNTTADGLIISDVNTTGAIAKFGFREGDRIVSVNGQRIAREADFTRFLFAEEVRNERVEVVVIRGGREQVILVQPTVFIEEFETVRHDPLEHFGIILDDRFADRIVVWKVVPRSPAFYAGIRSGDVITTFHGRRIASPREFVSVVETVDPGMVAVDVMRNERARRIQVDVPRIEARTALRPNIDTGIERRQERREDRRDDRQDRRDFRRGR